MYNEGHEFLFAYNTFHLPHGSLNDTREALAKVQVQNLALIRHATLRFSLHDVDRKALDKLKRLVCLEIGINPPRSRLHLAVLWAGTFTKLLVRRWDRKIQYLKATLPGLESACFEIRTQANPLKTARLVYPGHLVASLDGSNDGFAPQSNWLNQIFGLQVQYEWKLHALMEFAAKQIYTNVLRNVLEAWGGGFDAFMVRFDAEYVARFDNEILGLAKWSRQEWSVYGPAIMLFKEPDNAVSPYNPSA